MKELVFKRQSELEEIYKVVHMDIDIDKARQLLTNLVESGPIRLFFSNCIFVILLLVVYLICYA